jgi:hypothetical protein
MRVGFKDSVTCGAFTFIPLYSTAQQIAPYVAKRSKEKVLQWRELSPKTSADVHVLTVDNNSSDTVLIPVGKAIAGGYQDRVVAASALLPPRSQGNYITTFCIEKGRWGGRKKPLKTSTTVDGILKQLVITTNKQTPIWQYITDLYQAKGLKADVQPYLAVKPVWQNIPPCFSTILAAENKHRDSLIGWAVSSNGQFVTAEAFQSPILYQQVSTSTVVSLLEYTTQTNKANLNRTTADVLNNLFSTVLQSSFLQQHGKGYYQGNALFHLICY